MNTLKHIPTRQTTSRWQLELGDEVVFYRDVTGYDFPFTEARLVDSPCRLLQKLAQGLRDLCRLLDL